MVKKITPAVLERATLSMYSTVIFYGISELPNAKSAGDVAAYVRGGGGVLLIPDASVNPVKFNETFAPLLSGFQLGSARRSDKALLIEQWTLDDIDADLAWCGRDGSPTKVHRIQAVVLAGGEYKEFPPTDEGAAALVGELIEDHTIG
jgi:hypothetical protein